MKKKFIIELDEEPSLVFIQRSNERGCIDVYQDGELVKGWIDIDINASVDDITTHNIKYATGHTK